MSQTTRLRGAAALATSAVLAAFPVASLAAGTGHGASHAKHSAASKHTAKAHTHAVKPHSSTLTTSATSGRRIKHVLLISVDGLHASDLAWYVSQYPKSTLARLSRRGRDYTRALTPVPSDSYPGIVGQVTGGDPRATGIYYDAEYNYNLLPAGTTNCTNATPGTPVNYEESIDKDNSRLDAGQGLSGLPGSILSMTSDPLQVIDPSKLPVDPATCKPVYPYQYLQANTIFEVARAHGLRTAWSDKHPAYEILAGPSGTGVQDFFTPEINSNAIGYPSGNDWTTDNAATMQYDSYKVQAVVNEIKSFDHSGTHKVGTPAIFGMNFQTVSTAEKLPTSDGLTGGYLPGTTTPGPLLQRALHYINRQLTTMVTEINAHGLANTTAIIVSAKHGQSPQDPNQLTRIDDGPIIDAINAAWKANHPTAPNLVAASTNDDAMMMWLSDRSQAAADFVKSYLLSHDATGNTASGATRTLHASGLRVVYAGAAAAQYFGVPKTDPRHPTIWGIVQQGVVYTGHKSKIAEHGGASQEDRNVALLVYAPRGHRGLVKARVETTQIAPTILRLLGLSPRELRAVRQEGTPVLPGF